MKRSVFLQRFNLIFAAAHRARGRSRSRGILLVDDRTALAREFRRRGRRTVDDCERKTENRSPPRTPTPRSLRWATLCIEIVNFRTKSPCSFLLPFTFSRRSDSFVSSEPRLRLRRRNRRAPTKPRFAGRFAPRLCLIPGFRTSWQTRVLRRYEAVSAFVERRE